MKKLLLIIFLLLLASQFITAERKWTSLPMPLSNNAVAAAKVNKKLVVFSFMGIGAEKTWNSISNKAFGLDTDNGKWSEIRPVPGPAGPGTGLISLHFPLSVSSPKALLEIEFHVFSAPIPMNEKTTSFLLTLAAATALLDSGIGSEVHFRSAVMN